MYSDDAAAADDDDDDDAGWCSGNWLDLLLLLVASSPLWNNERRPGGSAMFILDISGLAVDACCGVAESDDKRLLKTSERLFTAGSSPSFLDSSSAILIIELKNKK